MRASVRIKEAFITALIAAILALPLAGVKAEEGISGQVLEWRLDAVAAAAALVFAGRLFWGLATEGRAVSLLALAGGIAALFVPFPSLFLQAAAVGMGAVVGARYVWEKVTQNGGFLPLVGRDRAAGEPKEPQHHGHALSFLRSTLPNPPREGEGILPRFWKRLFAYSLSLTGFSYLLILLALIFPFTPLANRYALDVSIMVLTYVMLALGLNLTVGYAGLLDLGFAGFYAIGAYCYALLAQHFGISFWACLPIAGLIAAGTGFVLGAPVLRLRGDYFAVVTLGFGEIVRLVLINWNELTGGPNGISDIPRPTLFGLEFTRSAKEGQTAFTDYFHIAYDPTQRVIFLYFIILGLALAVGWFGMRIRRLPLGRAWESFREDEIACASLGINRTWIKLAAYSLGALVAGLAGAFFAARQGFVSPESFTFTESATILAIVILGGIGHPLGIVLAAVFVIGLPELFRGFEQYRMLAFGLGMVLIMVWRPGGMMAVRQPTVRLAEARLPEKI
jgi:branched-chain amino acid transport system permease protein